MNDSQRLTSADHGAERFHELCARYLADELDASELAEFTELLSTNESFCSELSIFAWHARLMAVRLASELNRENIADHQGGLGKRDKNSAPQTDAPLPEDSAPQAKQTQVLGFLGTIANQSATWLASPKVLAFVVVGSLATYFVGLMISIVIGRIAWVDRDLHTGPQPVADAPARVLNTAAARWQAGAPKVDIGAKLPGGPTRLASGILEIEFDGGARVCVVGPAEFTPQSGACVQLTRGRLTASVPSRARGFIVTTPSAELIDLGTEFGVEVDGQGATDLHVIKGRVEVKPTAAKATPGARTQQVFAGQAIRVSAGSETASSIPLDGRRFEAARIAATGLARAAARSQEPFPEDQSIWLGNLFDNFEFTGVSLAAAIKSDSFRARAEVGALGVERVLYAGSPVKEIAPGVSFDATNLGWQDLVVDSGHVTNDAWTDANLFADENGARGGIRTEGKPMGYNEPKMEEGIGQHPNALITFDLDKIRSAGGLAGRALEFRCDRAGINDGCMDNVNASAHMAAIVCGTTGVQAAFLNGQRAQFAQRAGACSITSEIGKPLRGDGHFVSFVVMLPSDAKWLTLLSACAGDGFDCDHAVWSGARLKIKP